MKKHLSILTSIFLACFLIIACSSKGPKAVADKFWDAAKDGNTGKMQKLVTKSSLANLQEQSGGGIKKGDIELGKAKLDGDKALIPTAMDNDGFKVNFETVAIKEDGKWKVDLNQTMMSMMGAAMAGAMKEMDTALEGIVEEGMKDAPKIQDTGKDTAKAGRSYNVGDKIMVEWKGSWWPASIIAVDGKKWKINYDGYNSSWDEWVTAERIKDR